MSRRQTAVGGSSRTGLSRAISSASIAMPPPKQIPTRPGSVMSTSGTSARQTEPESQHPTPRKSSVIRRNGLASSGKGKEGENGEINIQVVVRCRGRSPQELATSSPIITTTTGPIGKSITVETTPMATSSSLASFTTASSYGGSSAPSTKTYPFDKVFGPEADQSMVFDEVAEGMLDEVLSGYNCTIFAYGQTGTGKTYTMQGDLDLSPLSAPSDSAGIVPRVLHRLFALLNAADNTEFSVKCSYVELYNEELRDLLSADYSATSGSVTSSNGGGLKLYEDGKKGTMIQGLEEVGVKTLKEALAVVNKGCQKRQVAETKMNTESSRSHTILSITVHVKEQGVASGGEDLLKVGKFNLVDLAGSEAIGRSGATDKRAREAGMINQSLLTLGRVISALVEKGPHIPYRESKLTRLLQDSLGGKTKTCIVATVSPTRSNMEETLSTLDYAIRAKSIRNRPEINQHLTKTGLLKEYLGDIERLKAEVLAAREKNGIYIPEEQWKEMQDNLAKQKSDYEEAKLKANSAGVELATKKKAFDELCTKMLATTEELVQAREAERQLGELVEEVKSELEESRRRLEEEVVVAQAYEQGEERLDQVATGLRDLATESVSDVGGLFDKLARKAKVLGNNADASTRFGSDLQGLSKDLRHGLAKMHSVQGELGKQLEEEMSAHARKGKEISQQDIASLEASFSSFNTLTDSLSTSIAKGQLDATSTSQALLEARDEVQSSVRQWALRINERSTNMVDDILEHQQEHLSMVGSVLNSTADLVDAVISTARDHLVVELEAAQRSKQYALEMANAEMSRLRSQNAMLARMLQEEKAKTARLRTDLISNLTNLIVDFTDTQDASWSSAVADVQVANESGLTEMQAFQEHVEGRYTEMRGRREEMEEELDLAAGTGVKQRAAGQRSLEEVTDGVRIRLQEFGRETGAEVHERMSGLNSQLTRMEEDMSQVSTQAEEQGRAQTSLLSRLSDNVHATHNASVSRTKAMCDDIASLSSTLLATHDETSKSFVESYSATSTSLDAMIDRTAVFLSEEIQEDVPTGVTPRKKAWNVPTSWERTQPREALIAAMKNKAISPTSMSSVSGTTASSSVSYDPAGTSPEQSSVPLAPVKGGPVRSSSNGSLASDTENQVVVPIVAVPNVNGLAAAVSTTSQMKIPRRVDLGRTRREDGKENLLAVLGEGGANIPRRARK